MPTTPTNPDDFSREHQAVQPHQAVSRSHHRWGRGIVTFEGKAPPQYLEQLRRTVSGADAAPDASSTRVRTRAFDQMALCWTTDGAATAISGQVWVWASDTIGWVRAEGGAFTDLGPAEELRIPGIAQRDAFVQVTAITGGGSLDLHVGGI